LGLDFQKRDIRSSAIQNIRVFLNIKQSNDYLVMLPPDFLLWTSGTNQKGKGIF